MNLLIAFIYWIQHLFATIHDLILETILLSRQNTFI